MNLKEPYIKKILYGLTMSIFLYFTVFLIYSMSIIGIEINSVFLIGAYLIICLYSLKRLLKTELYDEYINCIKCNTLLDKEDNFCCVCGDSLNEIGFHN